MVRSTAEAAKGAPNRKLLRDGDDRAARYDEIINGLSERLTGMVRIIAAIEDRVQGSGRNDASAAAQHANRDLDLRS